MLVMVTGRCDLLLLSGTSGACTPIYQEIAIDEGMTSYCGQYPSKQFIQEMPVRFGFKLLRC